MQRQRNTRPTTGAAPIEWSTRPWPTKKAIAPRAAEHRLATAGSSRTLEFTDGKRRLAPIGLLYHADSGATAGGVQALREVYSWVAKTETRPVFAWEYAQRVRNFYAIALARHLDDGAWHVYGLNALRTLRFTPEKGWPDFGPEHRIAAIRDLPSGRYVSFARDKDVRFRLVDNRPVDPVVVATNGEIVSFEPIGKGSARMRVRLRIRARVPVSLLVGNLSGKRCVLRGRRFRVRGLSVSHPGAENVFRFDKLPADTGIAVLHCDHS